MRLRAIASVLRPAGLMLLLALGSTVPARGAVLLPGFTPPLCQQPGLHGAAGVAPGEGGKREPEPAGLPRPPTAEGRPRHRRHLLKKSENKKTQSKKYMPSIFKGVPAEAEGAVKEWVANLTAKEAALLPCCHPTSDAEPCRECTIPRQEEHTWGRCALVGLSDILLDERRGAEIDAHDTVIRFGYAETHSYEDYVGSKTDVRIIRMPSQEHHCHLDHDVWDAKTRQIDHAPPSKAFVLLHNNDKGPKSLKAAGHGCRPGHVQEYKGVPVLWLEPASPPVADFRDGLFARLADQYGEVRSKLPEPGFKLTSGFIFLWTLYSSTLCSQLDLYGFADSGDSVHYFAFKPPEGPPGAPGEKVPWTGSGDASLLPMKPAHVMGAENYMLRLAMANSLLCIYGPHTPSRATADGSEGGEAGNQPPRADLDGVHTLGDVHSVPSGEAAAVQPPDGPGFGALQGGGGALEGAPRGQVGVPLASLVGAQEAEHQGLMSAPEPQEQKSSDALGSLPLGTGSTPERMGSMPPRHVRDMASSLMVLVFVGLPLFILLVAATLPR